MTSKFYRPNNVLEQRETSPARVYTDGFLYENLETILPKSSNREFKVLDIGCGSGYVRKIFYDLGYKIDYTGLDVKKHKHFDDGDRYAEQSKFITSPIEEYSTGEKFDFIISMFALEHIEDDKLASKKMSQMLGENGVQFHMVPSKFSFMVYFAHGYRRYNPRILSSMFADARIWRVCGLFSFMVHFVLITFMKRALKTTIIYRSGLYPKILKVANFLDKFLPIFPIAYIVIAKNSK